MKSEKENIKKEGKKENKEIKKLKEENKILNDKLLRLSAEIQNMKKRHEEEISRIYKYEGEDFIKKILEVLDNFERAISMDTEDPNDEISKYLNGIKLIYDKLIKDLEDIGIIEVKCLNEEFDPDMMEAIMTDKQKDVKSGIVTSVFQKGYIYKDKILRPAMVKVNE